MDGYNPKSCSALEKPFYRPVEAALRWCGLIAHEVAILQNLGAGCIPGLGSFPQWPCLRANTEKLFDAIDNNELPHGRDGRTVQPGDHVSPPRVTIRHTDLKVWMAKHFPDQKPAFLFDETERNTHSAINADSFKALQVERDALSARLDNAKTEYTKLRNERDEIRKELQQFKAAEQQDAPLDTRERNTLLTIIGVLCSANGIPITTHRKAGDIIEGMAAELGISIGAQAIGNHLQGVPQAMASRKTK